MQSINKKCQKVGEKNYKGNAIYFKLIYTKI